MFGLLLERTGDGKATDLICGFTLGDEDGASEV